jgi:hypothetical protein
MRSGAIPALAVVLALASVSVGATAAAVHARADDHPASSPGPAAAIHGRSTRERLLFVAWNNGDRFIAALRLDGSDYRRKVVPIPAGSHATVLEVGGRYLYWAAATPEDRMLIGRAPLRSPARSRVLATISESIAAVAVRGQDVYLAHIDGIDLARVVAGRLVTKRWLSVTAFEGVCGLAIRGNSLFYGTQHAYGRGRVARIDLDGTRHRRRLATGMKLACPLAADDRHVYWADHRTIGRVRLDGRSPERALIPDAGGYAVGLALAGRTLYWAAATQGEWDASNAIMRACIACATPPAGDEVRRLPDLPYSLALG